MSPAEYGLGPAGPDVPPGLHLAVPPRRAAGVPGAAFDAPLQAKTTTRHNAARFLAAFNALDVGSRLDGLDVPTLVLHTRGDRLIPVAEGQRNAQARVPGGRFLCPCRRPTTC